MESSLTCHHLYADIFRQYHRMAAEVHLIDSENTQLAKTLAREMLTQQQLLTTQEEYDTKPNSYPNRSTEKHPKKTRRRSQRQGANQGEKDEEGDEEGEEDEEVR